MFKKQYLFLKDWKFYFKLLFGLYITAVLLYDYLSPLFNGITVPISQQTDPATSNWRWFINDYGDYSFNFLSFFTTQSNILVALWMIFGAVFWQKEGKNTSRILNVYTSLAITTYISITGVVYNAILLPVNVPTGANQWFIEMSLHTLSPILMLVYFLFFMKKENELLLKTKEFIKTKIWFFFIYPIIWITVMMIRGEFRHHAHKAWPYQYFFMDVHQSFHGIPGYVIFIIAFIAIFTLIGLVAILWNYVIIKLNKKNNELRNK